MQMQGLPVSPEGLTSSRTAPHYYLMEILWLLTFPIGHLKVPSPFPFPVSLVFSHWHKDLSQILSLLTWEQESSCKGATLALCWSTHWRDSVRLVAALTRGTVCVSLPGRAAGFWYPSWAATRVEVLGWFTAFHTKHLRGKLLLAQAASTSAYSTLRWAQPLLQGRQWGLHLGSCRVGSHYSQ